MNPTHRRPPRPAAEPLERRRLLSATYYVSTAGLDTNPGTSPDQPWQTVAKVDATAFQPGDTVLFQRGDQWRESLVASSDGAAAAPITYGAYGDATAARPLFLGGDVLDPSAFVLATGTTYTLAEAPALNWVFADGAFTREAQDALTQAGSATPFDPTTDVAFVEATADTFYRDPTADVLYLNLGTAPAGHVIEAATRQDAVASNGHSHLAFDGLATSETADDDAGYGFRIQGGSDVAVADCAAALAGKHDFGVIDTTGFTGTGLVASLCAPDLGFGGASAVAFFVDASQGVDQATAAFDGLTFTDAGGFYPALISHGSGTDAIASLSVTDLVSTGGYGTGADIYSAGADEAVTFRGGQIGGGTVEIDTDDAIVDGVTFTGSGAALYLTGTGDVVQNCLFADIDPDASAGHPAAVVDSGGGSVVRLNTFAWTGAAGSAVDVTTAATATRIVGNVFAVPIPVALTFDTTPIAATSDENLVPATAQFLIGGSAPVAYPLATWQAAGFDAHAAAGDPDFTDAAAGDYSLLTVSPAIDLAADAAAASAVPVTTDLAGNPRPYGVTYDAGAFEVQQAKPAVVATLAVSTPAGAAPVANVPTGALFTVTLTPASAVAESVQYAAAGSAVDAGVAPADAGTVTFPPGVTTRLIRVQLTPIANVSDAGEAVALTLSRQSPGTALATASAVAVVAAVTTPTVSIGTNGFGSYTDGTARTVLLHLRGPGAVTVFRGPLGGDAEILFVAGTTAASTLTIAVAGGETSVRSIVVGGSLRALDAPALTLSGDMLVTGTVGRVTLGGVSGPSVLTFAGTGGRPSLSLGQVADASVTSAAPLASVVAREWTAASFGTITAPAVASLRVGGAFGPDVTLTGTAAALGSAAVGAVTGGTWTVAGRAGSVVAASVAGGWAGTFAAAVGGVSVAGDMAGSLTAASVGAVRVGGDLSAATVTLTSAAAKGYALASLRVGGTVAGTTVRSAGSVGAVSVGALSGSAILVGVAAGVTGLPTARTDFATAARLNALSVSGGGKTPAAVAASDVAAATIGRVTVGGVQTDNGGTPFGFAAESLAAYADVEPGKKRYAWTARDGAAALTTVGDYHVSLL